MARLCCRSLLRVPLALAIAAAMAGAVGAEPEPKPELVEPPKGPPVSDDLGQALDLPPWLGLGASWTAEPMGNTAGGRVRTGSWADQLDLELTIGSQGDQGWRLRASLANLLGTPPFNQQIGTLFPLQQVSNPQGFWLQGLWLEHQNGDLVLRAGDNLNLNASVGAPVYEWYVNGMINDTLNLALPGLPLAPWNSLGATADVPLAPGLSAHYGAFQLSGLRAPGRADAFHGWRFNVNRNDGMLQVLRLDWSPGPAGTPLAACRDVDAPWLLQRARPDCRDPVQLESQLPDPLVQLGALSGSWTFPQLAAPRRLERNANVLFAHATLPVQLPLGHGSRLWATGVAGLEPAINPVTSVLMGGLLVQGPWPHRPFDQLVLGLARSGLSSDLRDAGGRRLSSESAVEVDYILRINRKLALQPGVQWILNPGGGGRLADVVAPGLQISINF